MRSFWRFLLVLSIASICACGDDREPTGPSTVLGAPTVVSPVAGAQVTETRPTLTVANVTSSDGSIPTYTFQVASDAGFTAMVAQASAVAQGAGGRTSWQVKRVYLDGQVIITADYGPTYSPATHWIELGIQERKESIVGVVSSHVRIGPR